MIFELLLLFSRTENRQNDVTENKQVMVHTHWVWTICAYFVTRCLAVPQFGNKYRMVPPFYFYATYRKTHWRRIAPSRTYRQLVRKKTLLRPNQCVRHIPTQKHRYWIAHAHQHRIGLRLLQALYGDNEREGGSIKFIPHRKMLFRCGMNLFKPITFD